MPKKSTKEAMVNAKEAMVNAKEAMVNAKTEKLSERNKRLQSRIAVDLDGVLANFVLGWARVARQIGYVSLPSDWQPNEWSFHKAIGLSDEQNNNVWKIIAATPEFWNGLLPYQENVRALQHFLIVEQDKYDVFYLTSRVQGGERSVLSQTQDWLRRYLLLGSNTSIIPVESAKAKVDVINALGIDAIIDDYAPTVLQAQEGSSALAVLLRRPWNQDVGEAKKLKMKIQPVDNLQEFLALLSTTKTKAA